MHTPETPHPPAAHTVLLSQCTAAVFRASTLTLMSVTCPAPECRVTVPVTTGGMIGSHLGPHGECPAVGLRVIDDRVSPIRAEPG
jgi:hypothetical protein